VLAGWDALLMFCAIGSYSVSSVLSGQIRYDGNYAYVMYVCSMMANFCVTGTLWQIAALTLERCAPLNKYRHM
jgi:hypothetical protein